MKEALRQLPSSLMLAMTGSLGALGCFIDAFGLTVQAPKLIAIVIALSALYAFLFALAKLNRFLTGSLAAVSATIYFLLNREDIGLQALCTLYRVLHIGADSLGRGRPAPPPALPAGWASADTTTFFLFVMLLFVAALAWAVAAHKSFTLSFLLTMLFLAGPLFLTITPAWQMLMPVVAFWAVMLLIHVARHSFHARADWMGAVLLPLAALLIFIVGRAIPEEDYTRPEALNELRMELTMWNDINLNTKIFTGFGVGALGRADFSNTGDWHTNGALMLRVADGRMRANYLRGNTGAVYTGKGFAPIEDSAYRALTEESTGELAFLNGLRASRTSRVTLQYIYADKRVLYTPYYLVESPDMDGLTYELDRGIHKQRNLDTVTLTHMHIADAEPAPNESVDMRRYSAFVQEHYLQVPDALRATLAPIIEGWSVEHGSEAGYEKAAALARQYLRETAVYTLSPGVLPADRDFVEYFLLENKQGYCIHFASAGVMLLRMLGVPARYAEGYVVREADFNQNGVADIPDRQAHAWVEVFYEGVGWTPVELTPGASIETASADNIFDNQEEEPEDSLLEQTPGPQPDALEPPPDALTPPPDATQGEAPSEATGTAEGSADAQSKKAAPVAWLVLAALLGAGLGLRAYSIRKRKRSFCNADVNARVVAMYLYLDTLKGKRDDMRPDIKALAEKAQFSQHKLTETEAAHMKAYVEEYRQQAYKSAGVLERAWSVVRGL